MMRPSSTSANNVTSCSGGRVDAALYCKDIAGHLDCFQKISRHARQRSHEDVTEAVPGEIAIRLEAILKEPGQQSFIFCKSHHAIANVSRRQNLKLLPQSARTAAIVSHGDNSSQRFDSESRAPVSSLPT